jgi:Protein of unknown function (DUF4239)
VTPPRPLDEQMIRACEAMLRLWSDFVDAGHNSHEEATRISNLIRNARAFPPADAERFRSLLVAYTESVAGPEWESMAEGDPSPVTQRHYDAVWEEYYRFTPATEKASAFYAQSISRLNDLGEARRLRLLASRATVPTAMWMLLIVGFVVTIAWTYVFRLSSVALDIVAVGSIAALTGFVLFLIYALQHPFAGDVKISPEPFLQVARQFAAGG